MVPLLKEMRDIFSDRSAQRTLAQQHQLRQAFLSNRTHPALRKGIQIRASRRQFERLDSARHDGVSEAIAELRVAIVQQISPILQESPTLPGHVASHLLHPGRIGCSVIPAIETRRVSRWMNNHKT
jgi:hypothetical protein